MVIIALTLVSFLYPFLPTLKQIVKRQGVPGKTRRGTATPGAMLRDLAGIDVMATVAIIAIVQSASLNPEAAVFPRTIATGMLVLCFLASANTLIMRKVTEDRSYGSAPRRIGVPVAMLIAVILVPILGFAISGIIMGLLLMVLSEHARQPIRNWLFLAAGVSVVVLFCAIVFREVLSVPLPSGLLF